MFWFLWLNTLTRLSWGHVTIWTEKKNKSRRLWCIMTELTHRTIVGNMTHSVNSSNCCLLNYAMQLAVRTFSIPMLSLNEIRRNNKLTSPLSLSLLLTKATTVLCSTLLSTELLNLATDIARLLEGTLKDMHRGSAPMACDAWNRRYCKKLLWIFCRAVPC